MDILKLGTELLMSKIGGGGQTDLGAVQAALSSLIGNGDSLDLAGLVSGMQSGGLEETAKSWLGDGDNSPISSDQIKNVIEGNKLSQLASVTGTDENSILSGLQEVIPQMVDKSSKGGSLFDSIGGLGGAADLAKSFLK